MFPVFGAVLRKVLVNCFKRFGFCNNSTDFHFEKSYSSILTKLFNWTSLRTHITKCKRIELIVLPVNVTKSSISLIHMQISILL